MDPATRFSTGNWGKPRALERMELQQESDERWCELYLSLRQARPLVEGRKMLKDGKCRFIPANNSASI